MRMRITAKFLLVMMFFFMLSSTGWTQTGPDTTVRANSVVVEVMPTSTTKKVTTTKKKYMSLGTHPKDPNRQPDWETEVAIALGEDSPELTADGSSGPSIGALHAGTLIFVDALTRQRVIWIGLCGNDGVKAPVGWVPTGKIFSFAGERYNKACDEMKKMMLKLGIIETSVRHTEEMVSDLPKLDEIRTVVREELENQAKPEPTQAGKHFPPPVINFRAEFSGTEITGKVKRGSQVKLSWESQYTESIRSISGLGLPANLAVPYGEFLTPSLKHDETYIIECTGKGGTIVMKLFIDVNNHNLIWTIVAAVVVVAGGLAAVSGGGSSTTKDRPRI